MLLDYNIFLIKEKSFLEDNSTFFLALNYYEIILLSFDYTISFLKLNSLTDKLKLLATHLIYFKLCNFY